MIRNIFLAIEAVFKEIRAWFRKKFISLLIISSILQQYLLYVSTLPTLPFKVSACQHFCLDPPPKHHKYHLAHIRANKNITKNNSFLKSVGIRGITPLEWLDLKTSWAWCEEPSLIWWRAAAYLTLQVILCYFWFLTTLNNTCSTDHCSKDQLSQVRKVHIDQVVRLNVLIAKVHHHPQQGQVHLLMGVLLALLVHCQALPVWILHPSFAQSDCREVIVLHVGWAGREGFGVEGLETRRFTYWLHVRAEVHWYYCYHLWVLTSYSNHLHWSLRYPSP